MKSIMKDLARTFQMPSIYWRGGTGKFERVLLAFSSTINNRYVQEWTSLWCTTVSCSEEIALDICDTDRRLWFRDVYERNLPGLYKRCFVIQPNENQPPDLFEHLRNMESWLKCTLRMGFCLFSSLIPIHLFAEFLDLFDAWLALFYGLGSHTQLFKDRLLEEDEISGILYISNSNIQKSQHQALHFGWGNWTNVKGPWGKTNFLSDFGFWLGNSRLKTSRKLEEVL